MKYPKLPNVSSARGAPMGRRDTILDPKAPIKFRLYQMPMVDYCYDTGGAYWGAGSAKTGWMFHAYGDGPSGANEIFMRAFDREDAKEQVRAVFPNATFYR